MNSYDPEAAGVSSQRLLRVNQYLDNAVAGDKLPGILALAWRRGKLIHQSAHGKMDIEAGRPMSADAIFRIYSMTKPVVSLALMTLHDEGKFQLHDPVSRYLPGIAKIKVYSHTAERVARFVEQDPPMSVFHLLTHMAGFTYGGDPWHPAEQAYTEANMRHGFFRRDMPLSQFVAHLCDLPLKFQPGSDWQYSVAVDVIGHLIEVIADMPLADFLEERIFTPLGLVDTAFHVPPDKVDRLAQIYFEDEVRNPRAYAPEAVQNGDVTQPTLCPSGGGGLVSTLADYLRFAVMLINGGELDGARVTSPMTIRRMTTNAVPRAWLPLKIGIERYGYGFGLGFRVMLDVGRANGYSSPGEYGWSGMANTHLVIDPREELITLMMTQMIAPQPHEPRSVFPNLVYQAIDDLSAR